jgi:eukaryotic-like serine/threonine-protein kinase
MRLPPGTRLGPYEIVSTLGAGGMGEVYKAKDTRLDRLVAVKTLRLDAVDSGATRERFEREARAISSFSHQHVCALFDVGNADGTEYIVMELLEGETLGARIAKGPLPIAQLLLHGRQIAMALSAAHRQGIVHRDLKPNNVMLTPSGVKLLDFGLAKSTVSAASADEGETAASLTAPGTWLGTAPYMAPEQIEGRPADARSDIFALGVVLHEMSTGQRAFAGDTSAGIASSILRVDPPPPSSLRPELPAPFDRLVRGCLAKDPEGRWQSAHDIGLQLAAIGETSDPSQTPVSPRSRPAAWLLWTGAIAATALITAAVTMWAGRPTVVPPTRVELQINPPVETAFVYSAETIHFALSPDGQRLALIAAGPGPARRVWMRSLSSIDAKPVAGTENASVVFWSPDGQSIAFVAGDTLKRLELASGAAVTICKVPAQVGIYGTWSRSGEILFATIDGDAIYRVSTAGGEAAVFLKPDAASDEYKVSFPSFLPDGNRYLYLARHSDGGTVLKLGESGKDARVIMPIESNAQYVEPGILVFAKGGALVGQPFNVSTAQVGGEPFAIAERVRFFLSTSAAAFSASPNGALVFQSHDDRSRLAWIDRTGREVGTAGSPGKYLELSIARDGRTALASRTLPSTGTFDIWSLDLDRGTETRLTLDDAFTEIEGVMTPAGDTMIYAAARGRALALMRRDMRSGHDEPLLPQGRRMQGADDVSADGRLLAFEERTAAGNFNLWVLPLAGAAAPTLIRQSPYSENPLRFAPDGDHYVFLSNESGRNEVYVSRLSGGPKTMLSTSGAIGARWSRDGREVLYVSSDLRMMSVPVRVTPTLELGKPLTLFAIANKNWMGFDVSPDGKRFLIITPEVVANEQPLTAIQNWNPARAK